MARIPDAELQHLKSAVSLVAIIEQQGRQLFKRGKDMTVLCPFHEEKTPSMVITPSKNLYHCFGCNAGGSVLDWVMQTEGLSLRHATERLKAVLGHNPAVEPLVQPEELASDAIGQQVLLSRVVEFYHHTLLNAPEAQAYLSKRRLNHPELVSHFKLGFANRTLAYRLPASKYKAGAEIRRRLQAVGVLRENGREHLRGSLVVPVMDAQGQIHELYGRMISDDLRASVVRHLYLPGAHKGVWNAAALGASKTLILCESLIDAMSFWVAGQRHVTAAYGVHGVTADHWQAFEHYSIKQVLIAFDNDSAGNEAAVKLASALVAKGITPLRVVFPPKMDANEYLCQMAEPETDFALLLESAVPMQEAADMVALERQTPEPDTVSESASPLAAEPAPRVTPNVVCESGDNGELLISVGTLQWYLRGMSTVKAGAAAMKLNAQVLDRQSGVLFADGVDLMSGRSRNSYSRMAAAELGLTEGDIRRALGQVLLAVEQWQQQGGAASVVNMPTMSDTEQEAALALLQDPYLTARITTDLAACGVVGESTNLLAGFLAAVSRKLPKPLAVLIQSSSAAGKSSLMDAVLNLIPEEERIQYSAMTGQSLFYLGETNLQHKILAIAEEEGVRQAAYALKLLQSDGELTMASTGKDEATGNLVTKSYTVKGPVMLM
uniref:CHC2 zinc finger domain-containing protein n=1 Tax=Xenorhabdus sp. BG5 TaxID=2782014 RepID=UPI0018803120